MTDPADKRGRKKGAEAEGEEATTLEARLRRLEEIMGQLEADEVDVERALALFEEGVAHVRAAEKTLARAELRVEELLSRGKTRPLAEDEDSSGNGGEEA